jgi:putative transposase
MNWKMITSLMSYKSRTTILNPKNSTKTCSRCGKINAPKGASYKCKKCGLRIDRQLNAAVNLYLQMEGLPHDPEWFDKVVGGFALTGEEADEGSNEPWRSPRLMNPKSYVSQSKTT